MSRTALRKELKNLSHEQTAQLVMDIYAACPDAHRYLDFFIDPDVDKLTDKFKREIDKEFERGKRGYTKARFTIIQKLIKTYDSYGVGAEAVLGLMLHALRRAVLTEHQRYVQQSFFNGLGRLAGGIVTHADKNMLADRALAGINDVLADPYAGRAVRNIIRHAVDEAVSKC